MDNPVAWLGLVIAFIGTFMLGRLLGPSKKKKKKSKYPKCDCKDVNQCSKWCNAKHLFKKDSDRGLI